MEPTVIAAIISLGGVVVTVAVTFVIAFHNYKQQQKLNYLQTMLQTESNRVRIKSFVFTAQYLASLERVFGSINVTPDKFTSEIADKAEVIDILRIWIYTRERLWHLRNKRKDKGDYLEEFEEFLFNNEWLNKWRYSNDHKSDFFNFFLGDEEEHVQARIHFSTFCVYVKNFMTFLVVESKFSIIFATAPRHRMKFINSIDRMLSDSNCSEWQEIERTTIDFLSGKNWE